MHGLIILLLSCWYVLHNTLYVCVIVCIFLHSHLSYTHLHSVAFYICDLLHCVLIYYGDVFILQKPESNSNPFSSSGKDCSADMFSMSLLIVNFSFIICLIVVVMCRCRRYCLGCCGAEDWNCF